MAGPNNLQDIQHTERFCIVDEIRLRENDVEMNSIKRPMSFAFLFALHLCVHDIISNTKAS